MTISQKLTIIFIFFSSCLTFGQTVNNDTTVLKVFINQNQDKNIAYIDKTIGWERIQKSLDRWKNSSDSIKLKQKTSIALTDADYYSILEQIDKYKNFVWGDSLFVNSKRVLLDSMYSYLDNEFKLNYKKYNSNTLDKDTAAIKNFQKYVPWVFGFSKPIYLREETLCLYYSMAMCGQLCGHDEVSFYKKENGKWTKWFGIGSGVY